MPTGLCATGLPRDQKIAVRKNGAYITRTMSSGGYNNHVRLLQSPGYVSIVTEQIHDARIVSTDGRAPIPGNIRLWM
jgi:hypothetical protein